MMQPDGDSVRALAGLPVCLMVVALSGGCAGESQTVPESQQIAQPVPPPPPPTTRTAACAGAAASAAQAGGDGGPGLGPA